jgi:hypothetical protein
MEKPDAHGRVHEGMGELNNDERTARDGSWAGSPQPGSLRPLPSVEPFAEYLRHHSRPDVSPNAPRQVSFTHVTQPALELHGRDTMRRSVDDVVRELLHPLLKQWLNQHLPRIVEQLVMRRLSVEPQVTAVSRCN